MNVRRLLFPALTAVLAFLVVAGPVAAGAAVVAVLAHHLILRADWERTIFNVAQTGLYVCAGSVAFHALTDLDVRPHLPGVGNLLAVLAGACVMHFLNTLTLAGVVALQIGTSPLATWRADLWLDFSQHVVLVVLGVLLTALVSDRPWSAPLVVPALVLVYLSLRRSAEVRAAAQATTEAAGDIVDLLTHQPAGHSRRVATWTRRLADQLGLPAADADAAVLAAHLHGTALPDAERNGQTQRPVAGMLATPGAFMDQTRLALGREPNAASMARHLGERWDGTGTPDALAGDAIPIGARLVAVADELDRMTMTSTPDALHNPAGVLAALRAGAGSRWDPTIVDVLGQILEDVSGVMDGLIDVASPITANEPFGS
jgi:hypothetical protein